MEMPLLLCINLIPLIDLIIVLMKPVFLLHPRNVSATLDDHVVPDITITCAAEGSPKPVITWLENNSTIVNETGYTQNGTMSILTLKIHKKRKMPNYRCRAINTVGVTLSEEATITFLEKETTTVAGTFDLCDSRFPSISNEEKINTPHSIV